MRQFICLIRTFLCIICIFVAASTYGQSTYPIRTDTLRVYSGSATGPTLKLESSTSPLYNWYLYTNGTSISRLGSILKLPYTPAGDPGTDSILVKSAIDSTIRAVGYPSITVPDLQAVTDVGATTTNPITVDVTGIGPASNALQLAQTSSSANPTRLRVRNGFSNAYIDVVNLGAEMRLLGANNSTILLDGPAQARLQLTSSTESKVFFNSGEWNIIDMGNGGRNRLRLGSLGAVNDGLVITNFSNVPVAQLFTDGRMGGTAATADTQFVTRGQVTDSLNERNADLVHISGTQTITGPKTFTMTVTSFGTYLSTNGTVQSFQGVTGGTVGSTGTFSNHDFEFYSNNSYRGRVNAAGRWQFGPTVTDDGSTRMQVNGNVSANAAIASNHLVTRQQVTDSLNARLSGGPATLEEVTTAGNSTTSALVVTGAANLSGHPNALILGYDDVNNAASIISGDYDGGVFTGLSLQAATAVFGTETLTLNGSTAVTIQSNAPVIVKKPASADLQRMQGDKGQVDEDFVTKFQLDSAAGTALQVGGPFTGAFRTVTVDATLGASDYTLVVDNTTDVVMTLPPAATYPGRVYVIKKISINSNTVTLEGDGTDTIDGELNQVITSEWGYLTVQAVGPGTWIMISSPL